MISGSLSLQASNNVRDTYSYINGLISGATESGLYQIYVGGQNMTDNMAKELVKVYGYRVTDVSNTMGSFPVYKIQWNPDEDTSVKSKHSVLYWGNVYGSPDYDYGILDFYNGTATVTTGSTISTSDWVYDETYPVTNLGYTSYFYGQSDGNNRLFVFMDYSGNIVETWSGYTSDIWWDYTEDKGFFLIDSDAGILKRFDGEVVTTFTWDYTNYGVDIEWDYDASTNERGMFISYYPNDYSEVTYKYLVNGEVIDFFTYNPESYRYYKDVHYYANGNFVVFTTYDDNDGKYLDFKVYDLTGQLLENVDLSSYNFTNYDYSFYGFNKYTMIFYNEPDYLFLNFDGNTQYLITEEQISTEYYGWNWTSIDTVWPDTQTKSNNMFLVFYDDNGSWFNALYSVAYCGIIAFYEGVKSTTKYYINNSGNYDKYINPYAFNIGGGSGYFLYDNGDGNFRFATVNKNNGLATTQSGLLSSEVADYWDSSCGDYWKIILFTSLYGSGTHYLVAPNSTIKASKSFTDGSYQYWTNTNIVLFYNETENRYYYANKKSIGTFTKVNDYFTNLYYPSWTYTKDSLSPDVLLLINYDDMANPIFKVISSTKEYNSVSLPTNGGNWWFNFGQKYVLYSYLEPLSGYVYTNLYKHDGTIVNTQQTTDSSFNEGGLVDDRVFYSTYTTNEYANYTMMINGTTKTFVMQQGYYDWTPNDMQWWD